MHSVRTILLSLAVAATALTLHSSAMANDNEPCIPDCLAEGKECGFDGCCGSCGTCLPPETCNTQGQCELACTPWCSDLGYTCGPDGCSGSCGTCLPGQQCLQGQCTGNCTPQCQNKVCGPDGCELGNVCGFCAAGQECNEFGTECVEECADGIPDCTHFSDDGPVVKQCGSDGCGGECGLCLGEYVCDEVNFVCVLCGGPGFPCPDPGTNPDQPCQPTCAGSVCGPDGCGASCGECDFGQSCLHGLCVDCTPNCVGSECGGDGCGGSCGVCEAGFSCLEGTCAQSAPQCLPDCFGKSCGTDGCGGSCGVCAPGQVCDVDGRCSDSWSVPGQCDNGEIWNFDEERCIPTGGSGGTGDGGGCASHTGGTWLMSLAMAAVLLGRRRRRA